MRHGPRLYSLPAPTVRCCRLRFTGEEMKVQRTSWMYPNVSPGVSDSAYGLFSLPGGSGLKTDLLSGQHCFPTFPTSPLWPRLPGWRH